MNLTMRLLLPFLLLLPGCLQATPLGASSPPQDAHFAFTRWPTGADTVLLTLNASETDTYEFSLKGAWAGVGRTTGNPSEAVQTGGALLEDIRWTVFYPDSHGGVQDFSMIGTMLLSANKTAQATVHTPVQDVSPAFSFFAYGAGGGGSITLGRSPSHPRNGLTAIALTVTNQTGLLRNVTVDVQTSVQPAKVMVLAGNAISVIAPGISLGNSGLAYRAADVLSGSADHGSVTVATTGTTWMTWVPFLDGAAGRSEYGYSGPDGVQSISQQQPPEKPSCAGSCQDGSGRYLPNVLIGAAGNWRFDSFGYCTAQNRQCEGMLLVADLGKLRPLEVGT